MAEHHKNRYLLQVKHENNDQWMTLQTSVPEADARRNAVDDHAAAIVRTIERLKKAADEWRRHVAHRYGNASFRVSYNGFIVG